MALTAIHPGEHLTEELEALDMSAAELARKINVPTNRITQILNGTRAITGDTALRLAHFFGTSAQFWLNRQSLYDLRLAQEKVGAGGSRGLDRNTRLSPTQRAIQNRRCLRSIEQPYRADGTDRSARRIFGKRGAESRWIVP
jgi:antitoxin HigA-1